MDVVVFIIFLCVVYTLAGAIGYGVIWIVKRLHRLFTRLFENGKENNV